MNNDSWARLKQLFDQAIQLEPGQRKSFALDNCDGDEALLEQLLRLIESHDSETQLSGIVQDAAQQFEAATAPGNHWRLPDH